MNTTAAVSFSERIDHLRATKRAQTLEKRRRLGSIDNDDHGFVMPPEDFAFVPIPNHADGSFYGFDGWADNFAALLAAVPVYVDPLDALFGRSFFYLRWSKKSFWNPDFDYSFLREEQEKYGIVSGIGADHHFAVDLAMGLELGWGGIGQKLASFQARNSNPQANAFYRAEEKTVRAVQQWIARHAQPIEQLAAAETRPDIRENLAAMAAINGRLITEPPSSFREACQWLAIFNTVSRSYNTEGGGGPLDQLLYPFYLHDRAAGTLTEEEAIFYLACLLLNDTKYYQLGGTDAQGNDATNELSFLVLEAAHRMKIAVNLTVRVHENLDPALLRTAVTHLVNDRLGWPRFLGDKAMVEGFMKLGYSRELARQRSVAGCHWVSLPGREYTFNDCVKINMGRVFIAAFEEMMSDPAATPSTEELWHRFDAHLQRAVGCTAQGLDFVLAHQKDNEPELMLNLLCHGTIEQGRDISDNGVELYNLCVDGSALATVADSFAALQQRIDQEHRCTWREIAAHIRDNYSGVEGERIRFMMKHSARYCQGDSLGDCWAQRLSRRFAEIVTAQRTPAGRIMIPGWFSWSSTISMGRELGATPDGRRAGEPISHGANPNNGSVQTARLRQWPWASRLSSRAMATRRPCNSNSIPASRDRRQLWRP
jgi:formate C-acetyltransferase